MPENMMHERPQSVVTSDASGLDAPGLDQAYQALGRGNVTEGMQALFSTLRHARATLTEPDWKRFCKNTCATHPIRHLVQQDLATQRSFEKPRSYAGDAVLLDYFYQERDHLPLGSSRMGGDIFRFLSEQRTASSLRGRRDLLARWIDRIAERTPDARVLSVACGHLREALLSSAVRERRLGELLAFDQDTNSLAVVREDLGHYGVKTVPGNVKALLKGQQTFSELDGVYAAGLYDYLPRRVAIQLTRNLFSMLRPGGRLLLANYADPLSDGDFKAYMEAFMDWWLIYRDEAEVEEWLQEIPRKDIRRHRVFRDETHNLIYLEVVRR
jgi:SAM-dependent methyltransferase